MHLVKKKNVQAKCHSFIRYAQGGGGERKKGKGKGGGKKEEGGKRKKNQ